MDSPQEYFVPPEQPKNFLAQMPNFRETSLKDHHLIRAAKVLLHRAEGLKKIIDIHIPSSELNPQPIQAVINNAVHVVLGYLEMLEEDGGFSEILEPLLGALTNLQSKIEECSRAVEMVETGSDLDQKIRQAKYLLVELESFFGDQTMSARSPGVFIISADPETLAAVEKFYGPRAVDTIVRETHFRLGLSLKNIEAEGRPKEAESSLLIQIEYAREQLSVISQQLARGSVERALREYREA